MKKAKLTKWAPIEVEIIAADWVETPPEHVKIDMRDSQGVVYTRSLTVDLTYNSVRESWRALLRAIGIRIPQERPINMNRKRLMGKRLWILPPTGAGVVQFLTANDIAWRRVAIEAAKVFRTEERVKHPPHIQVTECVRGGWRVTIRYSRKGAFVWRRTAYTPEDVQVLLDAAAVERRRLIRRDAALLCQQPALPGRTGPLYEGAQHLVQADAAKQQGGST